MKGPRWVLEFESRGFFCFFNKKIDFDVALNQ